VSFLDVDDAIVRQQRAQDRERDADLNAYLMCARWIFAGVDTRRQRGRQPHADPPPQECGFELSKQEAALRNFETKSKLENAEPFGEIAVASPVLPRVEAPIAEGPTPSLPFAV
jgi:hypothetical protein